MTIPLYMLLAFAAWGLFLVLAIGAVRCALVLTGRVPANGFPSGVPHGGDTYWRLNRAHLNTVENLPLFGALVVVGTVAHVASPEFSIASVIVMVGRVVQSVAHVSSGSRNAVLIRFTAFVAQVGAEIAMIGIILRAGALTAFAG